jgi:hypothetical protein
MFVCYFPTLVYMASVTRDPVVMVHTNPCTRSWKVQILIHLKIDLLFGLLVRAFDRDLGTGMNRHVGSLGDPTPTIRSLHTLRGRWSLLPGWTNLVRFSHSNYAIAG